MERSYGKLTPKMTVFKNYSLNREGHFPTIPTFGGWGGTQAHSQLFRKGALVGDAVILPYLVFSLFDSTTLAREVSKFQAVLLQTTHVIHLKINFPAFFIFKRIHSSQLRMLV